MEKKPTPLPQPEAPNLAEAIQRISEAMVKLTRSGLNRDAILALVKDDTGLAKSVIRQVLESLSTLAKSYAR
jgi:hypothetical protein